MIELGMCAAALLPAVFGWGWVHNYSPGGFWGSFILFLVLYGSIIWRSEWGYGDELPR